MYCPKNLHHLGKISDVAENLIQSYDSFEDSLLFLLLKQSKNKSSSKMVSVTMIKFAYLLPEVEDPPPPELALAHDGSDAEAVPYLIIRPPKTPKSATEFVSTRHHLERSFHRE